MAVVVQRATGPNLTVSNPSDVVYLKGDEFTDGSVRLQPLDEHINVPHIELRVAGIWKDTGLALDGDTLFLGNDVSIGAHGSHLITRSTENTGKSLLLETNFDDAGTGLPHAHRLGSRVNHAVFSSNETGEIITSLFELAVTSFLTAFRYTYYFKTGSVAATAPVTMTLSKGSTPGGTVVHTTTMPASQWAASVEVAVELVGALQLSIGAPLLLTISSAANFSLIGDVANGGNFFAMDFQTFELEDVISIPTGTDRFLADNFAGAMFDNSGNPVMFGEQGSLSTTTPAPPFPPLGDPPPPGV